MAYLGFYLRGCRSKKIHV
ncbi:hypothetical protein Zm00014a_016102 [Zea mays]|uniref:Uncharacterized protein n=1 Tax=Zea mays TaxID=4577 RepID=A0A3L6FVQ2_MAIZE|nr:hypothetical protein Zm00014a_016102 [Zea mays]